MVVLCRVGQVSLNDGDFDNLVLLTLRHIRVHPERGNTDHPAIPILRHIRVHVHPERDNSDHPVIPILRHVCVRVHPERGNIDRLVIFILRHVRVRVLPEGDVHALMADVHYLVVLVGQDREPPE